MRAGAGKGGGREGVGGGEVWVRRGGGKRMEVGGGSEGGRGRGVFVGVKEGRLEVVSRNRLANSVCILTLAARRGCTLPLPQTAAAVAMTSLTSHAQRSAGTRSRASTSWRQSTSWARQGLGTAKGGGE